MRSRNEIDRDILTLVLKLPVGTLQNLMRREFGKRSKKVALLDNRQCETLVAALKWELAKLEAQFVLPS